VTARPPQRRDLAMVFQSYALYPHMSVRENLAYGLKVRRTDAATIARQIASVAAALDIEALLDRRPAQLSGGQRQRVALGRAIVRKANAFLLDEPLSNLDPSLRAQARAELRRLHRQLGITVVYVTHDQEEAMTLGQRIAVLREGHLEQVATPQELYERPANRFVATFIGSPSMNLFEGAVARTALRGGLGDRIAREQHSFGIRPQDVTLVSPDAGMLAGTVDIVEPLGSVTIVHLHSTDGTRVVTVVPGRESVRPGDSVGVRFDVERLHVFDAGGRRVGA
jgi:ABC-type sugar transport system ATPase subunit